ncbi:MAG: peptidoglycan D,D-transpeptidase FtsI family protein [Coprococcus sp.]
MSKKITIAEAAPEKNLPENNNEEIDKKSNDKKNVPVLVITYFVVVLFIAMLANIIIFVVRDADTAIANSYNRRQSLYAEKVIKGNVLSSDGEVLAETVVDSEGNETRYYPYSNMFSHVVGYDSNGQSGVEMLSTYYLLNSNQNIIKQVYNALADKKNLGNNVVTTLDFNLQQTAYNQLGYNDGAVIVLEPSTGKILAMVSKPDFDPNNIENVIAETADSDSSCLLNRATQGLYPPGSTFKVLTALEYIREHGNYKNYSYTCEGEDIFSGVGIHCYNYKVHGNINLKDSLAYSCNTSFSNIGLSLDKGKYRQLCEDFLFNKELPYEGYYSKSSFVINADSDDSSMPQTAIGQGDTLITPLHNALIMSTIANGGVLMKPYIIDRIESCDGTVMKKFKPDTYGKIISSNEAATMCDLLTGVTEYGTASDYFYGAQYTIAGKTGTAEFNEAGDSHSWFIGFSNIDNPDIVVCVIVENASSTGASASYIARQVFDAYYANQ